MKKLSIITIIFLSIIIILSTNILAADTVTYDVSGGELVSDVVTDVYYWNTAGESWRCNSSTSWYIEKGECFPEEVLIVGTNDSIDIIDLSDDSNWMNFTSDDWAGYPEADSMIICSNPKITAINGQILIGDDAMGGSIQGIDFKNDEAYSIWADGKWPKCKMDSGNPVKLNISERNDNIHNWSVQSGICAGEPEYAIVEHNIHDIATKNIDGTNYAAAATNYGVSVVNLDSGGVTNSTNETITAVDFDSDGNLYYSYSGTGVLGLCGEPINGFLEKVNKATWQAGNFEDDVSTHFNICSYNAGAANRRDRSTAYTINNINAESSYLYLGTEYTVAWSDDFGSGSYSRAKAFKISQSNLSTIEEYTTSNSDTAHNVKDVQGKGDVIFAVNEGNIAALTIIDMTTDNVIKTYNSTTTPALPSDNIYSMSLGENSFFIGTSDSGAQRWNDIDLDGIVDGSDTFEGTKNDVSTTGISDLGIEISGSTNLYQEFSGTEEITLKDGEEIIAEWNHSFDTADINVSNMTLKRESAAVLTSGIPMTGTNTKTLYLDGSSYDYVCVKDEGITSLIDLSYACDQAGELKFENCDSGTETLSGITCTDIGSRYKITGLSHSGARGGSSTNVPFFTDLTFALTLVIAIGGFLFYRNKDSSEK